MRLGLSQEALGLLANVNRGTVASMEKGTRNPHPISIDRVYRALKKEETRQRRPWTSQTDPTMPRPYKLGIRLQGDIEILGHADTENERADLAELLFVALGRCLGREAVARLQPRFDDLEEQNETG